MKITFSNITKLICFLLLLQSTSCKKNDNIVLSSVKTISSFTFQKVDGTSFSPGDITVDIQDNLIAIKIPFDIDRSQLIPVINIEGKSIFPKSNILQNFTNPVVYTVSADDGSTKSFTVSVTNSPSPTGTVYIGSSDNNFYALDAATGALKWKYQGTASFAYSGATYAKGTVYVGGIDSYLYAFDAGTGAIRWRYATGPTGIESDAIVVDGTVYVGCNDDNLYAIDAATGTLKWKYLTGANVSSSPVVNDGVVYFGSSDSKMYALKASNGNFIWSYTTGGMINQSGAAFANGNLYFGSRDGKLYSLKASNGALNWAYSTNGISLEQSSPTVKNGIVYIGSWYNISNFSQKGSLLAINTANGQLVWEKLLNTGIGSSPIVAEGRLYITADDMKIYALDAATGSTLWQKTILPNSASPAVIDGIVYVGGGGSNFIYAFNAVNGNEIWKFPTTGLMTSCPLIVTAGIPIYSGDSGMQN
jgi:outer membrane protein assembly factor BamB